MQDYRMKILDLLSYVTKMLDDPAIYHTSLVIENFLQGWQMDVTQGHLLSTDAQNFLEMCAPSSIISL